MLQAATGQQQKKPGTQLFQFMYTDSHVNSRLALVVVMHATNANA